MILDAVTFWNEIDVLKLRLKMLDSVVDKFLIVEGDKTFQGQPNKYSLLDWAGELTDWRDKIIHRRIVLPTNRNPWRVEAAQRNAISVYAAELLEDSDILIYGDADEIWQPNLLEGLSSPRIAVMDFRMMSVYWRRNTTVRCSIAGYWKDLRRKDLNRLRMKHRQKLEGVRSGWQFSWMGGPEKMLEKAQAFSHSNYVEFDFDGLNNSGQWKGDILERVYGELPEPVTSGMMPSSWYRK